ncbi:MAG: carbohydrate-binding protein, partial [Actinomycetota bacterium]|nr:carbohydrate-binding protein [Actinomycetota bacterium]
MRTDPQHVAPPDPRRRRSTRVALGAAVAVALGGSGVYIATANAAETVIPGRLQAEAFSAQSGARTENTSDRDGGRNVGWLANGDWLRYDNVTVGSTVTARIASDNPAGGSIELRLGSPTGTLLTTIPVARTGGWQKWVTRTATVKAPAGKQKLVAVMKSSQKSDFVNINWFTVGAAAAPATPAATPSTKPSAKPTTAPAKP